MDLTRRPIIRMATAVLISGNLGLVGVTLSGDRTSRPLADGVPGPHVGSLPDEQLHLPMVPRVTGDEAHA